MQTVGGLGRGGEEASQPPCFSPVTRKVIDDLPVLECMVTGACTALTKRKEVGNGAVHLDFHMGRAWQCCRLHSVSSTAPAEVGEPLRVCFFTGRCPFPPDVIRRWWCVAVCWGRRGVWKCCSHPNRGHLVVTMSPMSTMMWTAVCLRLSVLQLLGRPCSRLSCS